MLVNFYIDPEAIDDCTNEYHVKELRSKWQKSGVLTHPSYEDGSLGLISRKFLQLNQEKQALWDDAWQEIENNPTRYLRCRNNFRVALVSEARARCRQIDNGDSAYLDSDALGRVEWVRLTEVNASKEFEHTEDLINNHIGIGDRITDIWQERFQSLARHTQDVAIVDQWAVRNNNIQGLSRLLRFINQDSNGCRITIYSSPVSGSASSIEDIRRRLWYEAARFDIRKVSSIEVRLFGEQDFGQYAHDRHIRFDHRVIGIGRGLDIFNSLSVQRVTGTTYTILSTGAREYKEESLDNNATRIGTLNIPVGTAML